MVGIATTIVLIGSRCTISDARRPARSEDVLATHAHFPDDTVRLVHARVPLGPAFSIVAEPYRHLGQLHFALGIQIAEGGRGGVSGSGVTSFGSSRPALFEPRTADGCSGPSAYEIIYGILRDPRDTVLARSTGALVRLRKVVIPTRLHAGGVLAYGAFSSPLTELVIRTSNGKALFAQRLSRSGITQEVCQRESEGTRGG